MAKFVKHAERSTGAVIYRMEGSTIPLTMGKDMFDGQPAPESFELDIPVLHKPWILTPEQKAAKKAEEKAAKEAKKAEEKAAKQKEKDEAKAKREAEKAEKEKKKAEEKAAAEAKAKEAKAKEEAAKKPEHAAAGAGSHKH